MCAVAAFLDRDGTINVKASDGEYVQRPEQFHMLPGAAHAVRLLNDAGMLVVVVTNQRGIALGRMTESDLSDVHHSLSLRLAKTAGAHVDLYLFCPHQTGTCACRKPHTGMLQEACRRYPEIDRERSFLIGDSASDVEAGCRFGLRTWQIGVDVPSLRAAVTEALRNRNEPRPERALPS